MEMRSEKRALDKIYKRRDRYEIPDWQRGEVWGVDKKRQLIDTILRGWKLPKFYFQKTHENPDEFDVVDGQQRLTAIWEFMDGELSLNPEQEKHFGGADYNGLPEALGDAFDDYEIEYDEITNASDEEVKDFFQRLQAGLSLTSSEKLNAVHSQLRDFCVAQSKHSFFRQTVAISDKRFAHFDIMAKVASIEIEGLDAGLRYDDVKGVFVANAGFSKESAAAKRIMRALTFFHSKFPKPFHLFRNRTIIQSMLNLHCHLQTAGMKPADEKLLVEFIEHFLVELRKQVELGQKATEPDYLTFQRTVNANVRSDARTRQEILLRRLFKHSPAFFSAVSTSKGITDGVAADRSRLADDLRDLVFNINDRYSGQHGKDLFKATNKTAGALTRLGQPVEKLEGYKSFIDDLYFLLWESTGERLAGSEPEAFKDVNELRTMLQHDVDHGKANKVAKKKKELSQTFGKYAGVPSPDAVDPALFVVAQVNILSAIIKDLLQLAKTYAQ